MDYGFWVRKEFFASSREVQVCPSLIHERRESEAGDWANDLMVDLEGVRDYVSWLNMEEKNALVFP